jgi:hypothetical protein
VSLQETNEQKGAAMHVRLAQCLYHFLRRNQLVIETFALLYIGFCAIMGIDCAIEGGCW